MCRNIFTAVHAKSTTVRMAFRQQKPHFEESCQNTTTVKMCNSTEVRSKLEFIIGTPQAAALQWREDHL
jgi:hypothetical protein